MKNSKLVLWLLLLSTVASAGSVWAHDRGRGGPRVGVYFGYSYPWYSPPPYYYYPPTVIVRPEPQVYIERSAPQPAPQTQAYWYYCTNPQGYYPYIKDCPGGWLQVVPSPPN